MPDVKNLIAAAIEARERAIATYSNFRVGAALQTKNGWIISAANVESASYGLSCCAERVAIFKALTDNNRDFQFMAIASQGGAMPCGGCRQLIAEYAADAKIIIINCDDPERPRHTSIAELMPESFTGKELSDY